MNKPSLLFFRHGNTFEADEQAVWIGASSNPALTAEGEAQADAAARYIENNFAPLEEITAGPLVRTVRFAEIVADKLNQNFAIDDRLREIDYGFWEGLNKADIVQRYGVQLLEQWEQRGQWPEGMGWLPQPADLQNSLGDFLAEQHKKLTSGSSTRMAVTSNGILRTIYNLITGKTAGVEAKVKTGNVCVLEPEERGWRIVMWNKKPDQVL